MKTTLSLVFLSSFMIVVSVLQAETRLWPVPEGEPACEQWSLEVNGHPTGILTARTADPPFQKYNYGGVYGFTSIDTDQPITLKIKEKSGRSLDQLMIRPLSLKLQAKKIEDGSFEIKVPGPCQFSVEPNGREHPLLVFVNSLEKDIPQQGAPNILWFGPGIHEPKNGIISLTDNQTLYLAPGAIVKTGIIVKGKNIKICGRGVIDSSKWEWRKGPTPHVISIQKSQNVSLEGVMIRGASHWTVVPYNSDNISIQNIKLCGGRVQNDDGINPCNSRNVTIRNCFIRTDDDCIAVKGLDNSAGNCEDVIVENCVFWCDRARIVLMGHESRAPYMRRITFRNCDIIHSQTRNFLLEPGENMRLENLLFENIRFEIGKESKSSPLDNNKKVDVKNLRFDIDTPAKEIWLFVGRPAVNQYMETKVPGYIKNCAIKNITVQGTPSFCGILFSGANEEHKTEGLTIENITLFDKKLNEKAPEINIGDFTKDVTIQ